MTYDLLTGGGRCELSDSDARTDHTVLIGATDVPHTEYLHRLRAAVKRTDVRFA